MKSYTGAAIVTMILYIFIWVPGFIANILYYLEAKERERTAGRSLPGVGCLTAMLLFNFTLIGLAAAAFLLLIL